MQVADLRVSSRGRLAILCLALAWAIPSPGAPPVVTFFPLTPTTLTLPFDEDTFVVYEVTNPSAFPHSFTMTPIVGVDVAPGSASCTNPFVLAAQESCVLFLHLFGSRMVGNISGGPVICITGNPMQCSQPMPENQLQATLVPAQVAALGVTPPALTIAIGHVATLSVDNAVASPVSAQNLSVNVPPASSITVDAGGCAAPLPPGGNCELHVGATAVENATVLVIGGDNTTTTSVTVTVVDDDLFGDGFDDLPAVR